jgi:hypothetical protein
MFVGLAASCSIPLVWPPYIIAEDIGCDLGAWERVDSVGIQMMVRCELC